jgi:hypothetical protein
MLTSLLLAVTITLTSPEAAVREFSARYMKVNDTWLFDAKEAKAFEPLLSKRLLRKLADLRECQKDWYRQQPKDTTDKPPYVDCCLFSGIPEGLPSAFAIVSIEALPDGRMKVLADFTWKDDRDSETWRDAYIVAKENGRWVIDDFDARNDGLLLSESYEDCASGKYVE